MLNLLQVEGFKSVGPRVTVDLAPLTALYGPAGAGKSTCLAALKFFKTAMADGTQAAAAAVGGDLRHQAAGWRGRAVRLRLVAQLAGSAVDYALALHVQGDRVTVARAPHLHGRRQAHMPADPRHPAGDLPGPRAG